MDSAFPHLFIDRDPTGASDAVFGCAVCAESNKSRSFKSVDCTGDAAAFEVAWGEWIHEHAGCAAREVA